MKFIIYFFLVVNTPIDCPYKGNPDIKCSVKQHYEKKTKMDKAGPYSQDSVAIWLKSHSDTAVYKVRSILKADQ